MTDRLSALDASFLYLQDRTTPMHVGSVLIFEPAEGFSYEGLVSLVSNRIAFVPRYRQRVRQLLGRILPPVWVTDDNFDVTYHVRRSALPRPGTTEQLEEFVARVQSRQLDLSRPLWELYLVDGLQDGRFAIVTKTHVSLVDGINAIDIGQIIVDRDTDTEPPTPAGTARGGGDLDVLVAAALDFARRPARVLDVARSGVSGVTTEAFKVASRGASVAGYVAETIVRSAARPAPSSPLNQEVGAHRRFAMVSTDLADYQQIRRMAGERGEPVSVNDVVLATVTGALRGWLLARGAVVSTGQTVRAMVPLSVVSDAGRDGGTGIQPSQPDRIGEEVMPTFVDLPVGEARPMMRLHQIAFAMQQQLDGGRTVGARSLSGIAGFAPPTLHSLGARLGSAMSRRMFNLVITNVPGPQRALYAAGAPLVASYPVIPLIKGQALAIGLTSYNGRVDFGLNADRDAMVDIELLSQCIVDALAELRDE